MRLCNSQERGIEHRLRLGWGGSRGTRWDSRAVVEEEAPALSLLLPAAGREGRADSSSLLVVAPFPAVAAPRSGQQPGYVPVMPCLSSPHRAWTCLGCSCTPPGDQEADGAGLEAQAEPHGGGRVVVTARLDPAGIPQVSFGCPFVP